MFVIMSLSGAQKRKLAALKKEKEAENQFSLSRWIRKQKPSPCEPVQQGNANLSFYSFGFQFSVPLTVSRTKRTEFARKRIFRVFLSFMNNTVCKLLFSPIYRLKESSSSILY